MFSDRSQFRPLPSIRVWLQSTSLLAVVAGYSLLFLVGGSIRRDARLRDHQRLADALIAELRVEPATEAKLSLPGVQLFLLNAGVPFSPRFEAGADQNAWLVSRQWSSGVGRYPLVEVRQNLTGQLQQDRTDQLLLIAAAGGSMLFTALLLRLVLRRGLNVPLNTLRDQLNALEADSLGEQSIQIKAQPKELQAIAESFNQLQARLSTAWQRERAFVDGVAHELRTPISVMSAQAQRLMQGTAPIDSKGVALQLIASEADRMGELVRVLLDFARSDSGRLQLELASVEPEALVLEAYERLLPLSPSRIRLAPPTSELLPWIKLDRQRLQQCFAALVDNALKFSAGPVTLSVGLAQGFVVFNVIDSGSGIPQQEREQVLERFVRGSSSVGTRGSGIGLAMVVLLIQSMKADLMIADAANGGADIQLRFRALDRPPGP
ncbi:HAMP domain-containing histidine kinase [bacterium]|nr:HAMP domain-containing histidine kinase [bacterium]